MTFAQCNILYLWYLTFSFRPFTLDDCLMSRYPPFWVKFPSAIMLKIPRSFRPRCLQFTTDSGTNCQQSFSVLRLRKRWFHTTQVRCWAQGRSFRHYFQIPSVIQDRHFFLSALYSKQCPSAVQWLWSCRPNDCLHCTGPTARKTWRSAWFK